ncbi:hypothetical protein [Legionella sp. km772]|uniref:hypothetical protein n=1 Tax=Legionella sp. km772 TaxID=2498111 RepID=UPI000F8E7BA2|nr:hypothetical protein [Legionella sp. km772]RUR05649.1 hypothetical protein ELY15_14080 [Legionella sp. km772]
MLNAVYLFLKIRDSMQTFISLSTLTILTTASGFLPPPNATSLNPQTYSPTLFAPVNTDILPPPNTTYSNPLTSSPNTLAPVKPNFNSTHSNTSSYSIPLAVTWVLFLLGLLSICAAARVYEDGCEESYGRRYLA